MDGSSQEIIASARADQATRVAKAEAAKAAKVAAAEADRAAQVEAAEAARRQAELTAAAEAARVRTELAEVRAKLAQAETDKASYEARLTELVDQAVAAQKQTKVAAALVQDVAEPVIMAVPEDTYQAVFDRMVGPPTPYRLTHLNGYQFNGEVYVNTLWAWYTDQDKAEQLSWVAHHGLTSEVYQERFNDLVTNQGFRLQQINTYVRDGQVCYAPIFTHSTTPVPNWAAYHGLDLAQHQAKFNDLTANDYRLVNQSVVYTGATASVAALYDQRDVGSWWARANITADEYQEVFDLNAAAGRGLSYLDVKNDLDGTPRFTAIWDEASNATAWVARHGLDLNGYHSEYMTWVPQGYQVRIIVGYQNGSALNYAVLWTR